MKTIKVKDKEFAVSITAETLQQEVKRVADEIMFIHSLWRCLSRYEPMSVVKMT